MSRRLAKGIGLALAGFLSMPAAATESPAGYVVSLALAAGDREAIRRKGHGLEPTLMMPLFAGDVVQLRDPASRMDLEMAGGKRVVLKAAVQYQVSGEIPIGDNARRSIDAITQALAEKSAPKNGNKLAVPMTVKGPNFLVKGPRNVWMAWVGGRPPFKLIVDVDGRAQPFSGIVAREFVMQIPAQSVNRFNLTIRDSAGATARVLIRFRDRLPPLPKMLDEAGPGETVDILLWAAWLTSRHEGDWSLEAAQLLRQRAANDEAAAALLDQIVKGWRLN